MRKSSLTAIRLRRLECRVIGTRPERYNQNQAKANCRQRSRTEDPLKMTTESVVACIMNRHVTLGSSFPAIEPASVIKYNLHINREMHRVILFCTLVTVFCTKLYIKLFYLQTKISPHNTGIKLGWQRTSVGNSVLRFVYLLSLIHI